MTAPDIADLAARVERGLADRYVLLGPPAMGGTAAVFPARELKHDRRVAIKVLRPDVVTAGLDVGRFEQEIRTLAALEHPNILGLIDSGTTEGLPFFVMPFIAGGTVRDLIGRETQLPVGQALRIAGEVAAALSYAHARGIVHRDIKPENILIHEGTALVSDFGISLLASGDATSRLTQRGVVVGTPYYMSPEQAAGERNLDARTDVFALGAVLYEMLTGEPPFTGATAAAVFAKMATQRPTPISVVRPGVPRPVETAVLKALAANPAERFGSMTDFAAALRTPEAPGAAHRSPAWAVAAVAVAAIAGTAWYLTRAAPEPVTAPRQLTFAGDAELVALSPDDQSVAYLADDRRTLVVKRIGSDSESRLATAETALGPPRWTASGQAVLVGGRIGERAGLFTFPVAGGDPAYVALSGAFGPGAATSRYDRGPAPGELAIVCCGGSGIYLGAGPETVRMQNDSAQAGLGRIIAVDTAVEFVSDHRISPDGRWLAFTGPSRNGGTVAAVVPVAGGPPTVLGSVADVGRFELRSRAALAWAPGSDAIYFGREIGGGTDVLVARFDPGRGEPIGTPTVIVRGLPIHLAIDVASNGNELVYSGGPTKTRLISVDPATGEPTQLLAGTWTFHSPRLSPDGRTLAFAKGLGSEQDVFLLDLASRQETRLTNLDAVVASLAWSPTGQHLAYVVRGDSVLIGIYDRADGGNRIVAQRTNGPAVLAWSKEGDSLVVSETRSRLSAISLATGVAAEYPMNLARNGGLGPGGVPGGPPGPPPEGPGGAADSAAPRRGRERPPTLAIMDPAGSGLVAVVPRAGSASLWRFYRNGTPIALLDRPAVPVLWKRDRIYFVQPPAAGSETVTIESVDIRGGTPSVFARLPFYCDATDLTLSPALDRAVCAYHDTTSDVWEVALGANGEAR
ncbi:MAG: LpqB family beta-propeller domain-containing protein [Gemmatimonadales bacterium]